MMQDNHFVFYGIGSENCWQHYFMHNKNNMPFINSLHGDFEEF